jgi:hypothetical protein
MAQFNLLAFADNPAIASLTGEVNWQGERLIIRYVLAGDMSQVQWPGLSAKPSRQDNLWQTTCFELFITDISSDRYVELNLSPSGDWQCYEFSHYRSGQQLSQELQLQSLTQNQDDRKFELNASLLTPYKTSPLLIGVNAILQGLDGKHHYYALSHQPDRPDFHHQDNFELDLSHGTGVTDS